MENRPPFSKQNLESIMAQLKLSDTFIESKVQQFLVEMGNDFIDKVLDRSQKISKNLTKKTCNPSDIKFVLKNMFDIEVGKKSHDEMSKGGFRRLNKELKLNNLKKDKLD